MPAGYISIGSNIDKEHHIPSSLAALQRQFGSLELSSVYETEPVGFSGDPFHNLVVKFHSELDAKAIGKILRQIERDHGRTRDERKFAARTLDLDLLLYGDLVIRDGKLQIPRDEIERYAFVLEPLAEIAGDLQHPVNGRCYADMWRAFDKTDLQQTQVQPAWLSAI